MSLLSTIKKKVLGVDDNKIDPALAAQLKKQGLFDISGKPILGAIETKQALQAKKEMPKIEVKQEPVVKLSSTQKILSKIPSKEESFIDTALYGKLSDAEKREILKTKPTTTFEELKTSAKKAGGIFKKGVSGRGVSGLLNFTADQIIGMQALTKVILDNNPVFKHIPENIKWDVIDKASKPSQKLATQIEEYAQKRVEENPQYKSDFDNIKTFDESMRAFRSAPLEYTAYQVSGQLPTFIAQITAALTGGSTFALGYMGLGAGGETYKEAKQAGDNEQTAIIKGLLRGGVEAKLESIGLEKLGIKNLKKVATDFSEEFVKEAVTKFPKLKGTAWEIITELLQNLNANVIARTYDKNREIFNKKEMFDTILSTGVLAGGTTIITGGEGGKPMQMGLSIEDVSNKQTAYHGTQAKEIKGVPNATNGTMGKAFYLADDAVKAESFGKEAKTLNDTITLNSGKKIKQIVREPNKYQTANVFSFDLSDTKIKKFNTDREFFDFIGDTTKEDMADYFRLAGYDGAYIKDNGTFAIYNTNKLKQTVQSADLLTEAKKYKSAEEFVKAQGTPVYHGTNYANARMIQKEGINPENAGAIQEWMKGNKYSFFTGDEKYAQSYAIQKGGGDTKSGRSFVLAIKSPKDIQIEPETFKKGMKFPDLVSQQKISPEDIYIKGIDNKWYPIKEFNFFTGESDTFVGKKSLDELPFKTKSQLKDIWNKAQNDLNYELTPGVGVVQEKSLNLKQTALKYKQAIDTQKKLFKDALGSVFGVDAQITLETNMAKKIDINGVVVQGIKNSPYWRKEGEVLDDMGRGWLMTKGDRVVVVTAKQTEPYLKKGWTKSIEIDQLAQEAGFDNGFEYLQNQIELDKLPLTKIDTQVHERLLQTNREYKQNQEFIDNLKRKSLDYRRFLIEKAKRFIETKEVKQEMKAKIQAERARIDSLRQAALSIIDNLPENNRGRMIKAVLDATTFRRVADLQARVMNRLQDIKEKQINTEQKSIRNQAKTAKITANYQRMLNDLLGTFQQSKPTEQTLQRLKNTKRFLQENPDYIIPDKYINELDRLTKKAWADLTIKEKQQINELAKHLIEVGKEIQKHRVIVNGLHLENEIKKATSNVVNLDKEYKVAENIRKMISGTNNMILPSIQFADKVDGDKNYGGWHSKTVYNLANRINVGDLKTANDKTRLLEEHKNIDEFLLDKKRQIAVLANLYAEQSGVGNRLENFLKANNLSSVPELTEQEQKIKEWAKRAVGEDVDKLSTLWETTMLDDNGRPMAFDKRENYFPFTYTEQTGELGAYDLIQNTQMQTKMKYGSAISRVNDTDLILRNDFYNIIFEHIARKNRFLAVQPKLFEVGKVFRSKEYQDTAGRTVSKWFIDYIDEIARNGYSSNAVRWSGDSWLRDKRVKISKGLLDLKVSSALKQPLALLMAQGYIMTDTTIGKKAVLTLPATLIKTLVSPKFYQNIYEKSNALKTRTGGEEVFDLVRYDSEKTTQIKEANFLQKGLRPFQWLQWLDSRTAGAVWNDVYNNIKDNSKLTEEQAKEKADLIMDLVSASSNIALRPRALNKGEAMRTLFTLQTFALNEWGILSENVIRKGLINAQGEVGVKALQARMLAVVALMFLFLQGYLEDLIGEKAYELFTGKEMPDTTLAKSALEYIPERIPILGMFIRGAKYGKEFSIPLSAQISNIIKSSGQIIGADLPQDRLTAGVKLAEAIGVLSGVRGSAQIADIAEGVVERKYENKQAEIDYWGKEYAKLVKKGEMDNKTASKAFKEKKEGVITKYENRAKKEVMNIPNNREAAFDYLAGEVKDENISSKYAQHLINEYDDEYRQYDDEPKGLDKVITMAKTLGTDPVSLFKAAFTNEKYRTTRDGEVIFKRLPLSESEKIKKAMGSVKGMYLDHTTPLGLGGDNSKKNLRLVSEADWKRYTKIENSLMKMVKEKKMTMKEAKKFIVDYKNGIAEVLDINSYIK